MKAASLFMVAVLTIGSLPPLCAQNTLWATFESFGEKEGFQNYYGPGQITRDREGLLWIGGDNGLFSFDGAYFTNYRQIAGNDSSLPSNVATMNYQDKAGDYWVVAPNKGLYRYDPVHRSFRRFTYKGMDSFDIHQHRISFFLDDGPLLWMGLPNYGLACWNRETATMQPYKICPPGSCGAFFSASWTSTMVKDRENGCYWIASNDGLLQFWPASGAVQIYRPPALIVSDGGLMKSIFNFLLIDQQGLLWCGTWGRGLLRFDLHKFTFTSFPWQPAIGGTTNICSGLYAGSDQALWVCSNDEGLMLFNKTTGSFRKVRSPDNPTEVIHAVTSFQSDAHTILVADQKRLYRYDLDTSRFGWYPVLGTAKGNNIPDGLYNFLLVNGRLYTGGFYKGGFGWYDPTSNRFIQRRLSGVPDGENIRHLSLDKEGIIWIATIRGTYLYDPVKDRLLTPQKVDSSKGYFSSHCRSVLHARDGSHWLATSKGLVRYNPTKSILEVFDTLQRGRHHIPSLPVLDLYEDSKGRIWTGMDNNGVTCYIPETDSVINTKLNISPIRDNYLSFCEDKEGNILFVLTSLGLVILENPLTGSQKASLCNSGNYLPTDYISTIFRDSKDRIWLCTANGLLLFDPVTRTYTSFREREGLMDNYIDSYPYQDRYGRIYLGFLKGFQTFYPDSLLARPAEKLHIRLNNLTVDGNPWPLAPNPDAGITLQPHQVNMAFSFAAVSSSLSGHYLYAYRLDGVDKGWNYTGNGTTGQYNNLPPGKHLLRIKAATDSTRWISDSFAMPVVVLPAWYQTLWFRLLAMLVLASLIYSIFRYRLQQVQREAAIKEGFRQKINELEMRTLRAQMNPHFIFNSLSSINRYIVKSDHKTASSYLTRFSKLIRLILDNSAADRISVEKELQTLQLYIDMEDLRFDHAFTSSINVDPAIDQEETFIPSMLLQPYVENAIWHGLLHKEDGNGQLIIRLTLAPPAMLMVMIEDNGVGRQKAKEMKSKEAVKSKSYGMQISYDRLELLNRDLPPVLIEDILDKDGTALGTRVILHIPIQYNPL